MSKILVEIVEPVAYRRQATARVDVHFPVAYRRQATARGGRAFSGNTDPGADC